MSAPEFADVEAFESAILAGGDEMPPGLPAPLEALWRARTGQWEAAHEMAQSMNSRDGDWIHAYLHRVEGDLPNASYWYRRAGQPVAEVSLDSEWRALVSEFLRR